MPFYLELEALKNIPEQVSYLAGFVNLYNRQFMEVNKLDFKPFVDFKKVLQPYYNKRGDQGYKILDEKDIAKINQAYTNAMDALAKIKAKYLNDPNTVNKQTKYFDDLEQSFNADKKIIDKLSPKDHLSLPEAAQKIEIEIKEGHYEGKKFKEPGFYEYSLLFINSDLTKEQVLERFAKKKPAEVLSEYLDGLEKTPNLYEYNSNVSELPVHVRNSGNVEEINKYLEENKETISHRAKIYLKKHIEAIQKMEKIKNDAKKSFDEGKPYGTKAEVIVKKEDSVEIKVKQPAIQTSANGCWSCAAQMLIASQGIKGVTQEDIRAYRPKLTENDTIIEDDEINKNYSYDEARDIMEKCDSILEFAPNSMLHELCIMPYSYGEIENGIEREDYLKNAVNLTKKQMLHALKEDKSAIALYKPGHYITVVGIDGDNILYKDSKERKNQDTGETYSANQTFRMPLSKFVEDNFFKNANTGKTIPIKMTWLSEIKLAADGKTIHGLPSEYAYMNDDGQIVPPPEEIHRDNGGADVSMVLREGIKISRIAGDERKFLDKNISDYTDGGIRKIETVYLPKKLNAAYLKKQLEVRSAEEEKRLTEIDKTVYGLKGTPKAVNLNAQNAQAGQAGNDQQNQQNQQGPEQNQQGPEQNQQGPEQEKPENENQDGQGEPEEEEEVEQKSPEEERVYANQKQELKRRFGLRGITDIADKLYKDIDDASHFYLIGATPAYGDLKASLKRIKAHAKKGIKNSRQSGKEFTLDDCIIILKDLKNSIRYCENYLNKKYKDIQDDPRRKNDPGKSDREQDRIFTVISTYNKLLEVKSALKSAYLGRSDFNKDADYRNKIIEAYKEELLASNPELLHDKSFENQTELAEAGVRAVARADRIFAPDNNAPSIPAIGVRDYTKNLSDKDFAALSIGAAASFSEYMKNSGIEKNEKFLKDINLSRDDRYRMFGDQVLEVLERDMTNPSKEIRDGIESAKDKTRAALAAYHDGDKEQLAQLIAEGINGLADFGRYKTDNNSKRKSAYSEMGRRMINILNRDQDLMTLAIKKGLDPKSMTYMKQLEIEAKYADRAEKWSRMAADPKVKWTRAEKEERYSDMLINKKLQEMNALADKTLHKNEYYSYHTKIADEAKQQVADREAIILHNRDAQQCFGKTPEYIKLINEYKKKHREAYDAKNNSEMIKLENKLKEDIQTLAAGKEAEMLKYENELLEKHKDYLDGLNNDIERKGEKKLTRNQLVMRAANQEIRAINDMMKANANNPEQLKKVMELKVKAKAYKDMYYPLKAYRGIKKALNENLETNKLIYDAKIHHIKRTFGIKYDLMDEYNFTRPGAEVRQNKKNISVLKNFGALKNRPYIYNQTIYKDKNLSTGEVVEIGKILKKQNKLAEEQKEVQKEVAKKNAENAKHGRKMGK